MQISCIVRVALRLTVIGFVFSLTIEVCSRLEDSIKYGAPFWGKYSAECLKFSENGIPYNLPNARFEKWKHNGLGFRGPEISIEKQIGESRVVCLGASESYGLYESPDMEWPAQLRKILPSEKFQVINASVVGLGMRNFEPYLHKRVLPLHPDIVVLCINPFFYAAAFEKSVQPKKTTVIKIAKSTVLDQHPCRDAFQFRSLPRAKQALKQALSSCFPDSLRRYQLATMKRQISSLEREKLRGLEPRNIASESSLISFKQDLTILVRSLKSQGIEVVLCSYPALIDHTNLKIYPEIFLDNRRFFIQFSLKGMIDILERFNLVVHNVAIEERTIFVDAHAIMPKNTKYFGDNVHYTDVGARRIAEAVARKLQKEMIQ